MHELGEFDTNVCGRFDDGLRSTRWLIWSPENVDNCFSGAVGNVKVFHIFRDHHLHVYTQLDLIG